MRPRAGHVFSAELLGYGATCDAHHPTAPHEEGRGCPGRHARALRRGVPNVRGSTTSMHHGTGTLLNDSRGDEGDRPPRSAKRCPVSSSKSYFGHTLGASGGIEAVISVLALRNQLAPPTRVSMWPRPIARSDYVPPHAPADDDDEHSVEYVRSSAARTSHCFSAGRKV